MNFLEALCDVAAITLSSEITLVNIVPPMAATACRRQLNFAAHRNEVTAVASQSFVRTVEDIVGLLVMVEYPQRPAVRVMAAIAVWAETLTVNIIAPVAVDTGVGGILVGGRKMTLFTRNHCMQSDERKLGQVVIEEDFSSPRVFVMTIAALFPLLTIVNVVARMTAVATHGQLFSFLIC